MVMLCRLVIVARDVVAENCEFSSDHHAAGKFD